MALQRKSLGGHFEGNNYIKQEKIASNCILLRNFYLQKYKNTDPGYNFQPPIIISYKINCAKEKSLEGTNFSNKFVNQTE